MKALDDHIAEQEAHYQGGDFRACFICHQPYGIDPGLEDICGTCLDCCQEAVRDALRYRFLRASDDAWVNLLGVVENEGPGAIDTAVDAAIDAAPPGTFPPKSQVKQQT